MTEDELIAEITGVPVPKFACGHPKGFSMGFGYSDPLAACRACRKRADRRKALVFLSALILIVATATASLLHWSHP